MTLEDQLNCLGEEFAKALRAEVRYDEKTGKPYLATHVFSVKIGSESHLVWIDIDEAPHQSLFKGLVMQREAEYRKSLF